jgi:hypothetical protein
LAPLASASLSSDLAVESGGGNCPKHSSTSEASQQPSGVEIVGIVGIDS